MHCNFILYKILAWRYNRVQTNCRKKDW